MTRSGSQQRAGTASVEAVMMLPFCIILYAAIFYMHGLYAGRQQALTQARSCAWAYSRRGCEGDPPTGCQRRVGTDDMASTTESGSAAANGLLGQLGDLPVIGDVVESIFGRPLETRARRNIEIPRRFGDTAGSVSSVPGGYFTLCNTTPRNWEQVAHDIFCEFMPGGFPGC